MIFYITCCERSKGYATLSANQTFTGTNLFQGSRPTLNLVNTNYENGVTPTETVESLFRFSDKNNVFMGALNIGRYTDNSTKIFLNTKNKDATKMNTFYLGFDSNDKVNFSHPQIITEYLNGSGGYRIWSNGYCEQWGRVVTSAAYTPYIIYLFKTYANSEYGVSATDYSTNYDSYLIGAQIVSSNSINFLSSCTSSNRAAFWRTWGYLASDQY